MIKPYETIKAFSIKRQVNNAGIGYTGNIETLELTELDVTYNVDVRAVVSLTQKFVPHLKKSKGDAHHQTSLSIFYSMTRSCPYR